MPDVDHDQSGLDEALSRHLRRQAEVLDVETPGVDHVRHVARRQAVRRTRQRLLAGVGALAVVAGVVGVTQLGDDTAPVVAVDEPGVDHSIPVPASIVDGYEPGRAGRYAHFDSKVWAVRYPAFELFQDVPTQDQALEPPEPVLSWTTDGRSWTAVDLDLAQHDDGSSYEVVATASRLLVVRTDATGLTAFSSDDGVEFAETAIDDQPMLYSTVSTSESTVFVVGHVLSDAEQRQMETSRILSEEISRLFPEHDGYGYSSDGSGAVGRFEVTAGQETLFAGDPADAGLSPEAIEALTGDREVTELAPSVVLATIDGVEWSDVDVGVDQSTPTPRSNAGLVVLEADGWAYSEEGVEFAPLDLPESIGWIEEIVATDIGVFAVGGGRVYRADAIDAQFRPVDLDVDTSGGTSVQVVGNGDSVLLSVVSHPIPDRPRDLEDVDGGTAEVSVDDVETFAMLPIRIERDGSVLEFSLDGGGTLTTPDGRVLDVTADDFGNEQPAPIVEVSDTGSADALARFHDPDEPGRILLELTVREVFTALAEQHPEHADVAEQLLASLDLRGVGESGSSVEVSAESAAETISASEVEIELYLTTDGHTFRPVTVDGGAISGFGIDAVPLADGTYLVGTFTPEASQVFVVDPAET